jgi:ABC-type sulfate/molybdate transport systems ATPase subunit
MAVSRKTPGRRGRGQRFGLPDLEAALEGFEGTLVAVSHDRAFLRRMDRFLMVLHDGTVLALPDYDSASQALLDPDQASAVPSPRC